MSYAATLQDHCPHNPAVRTQKAEHTGVCNEPGGMTTAPRRTRISGSEARLEQQAQAADNVPWSTVSKLQTEANASSALLAAFTKVAQQSRRRRRTHPSGPRPARFPGQRGQPRRRTFSASSPDATKLCPGCKRASFACACHRLRCNRRCKTWVRASSQRRELVAAEVQDNRSLAGESHTIHQSHAMAHTLTRYSRLIVAVSESSVVVGVGPELH